MMNYVLFLVNNTTVMLICYKVIKCKVIKSNKKWEYSDEQQSVLSHPCKVGKALSILAGAELGPAQPSLLLLFPIIVEHS